MLSVENFRFVLGTMNICDLYRTSICELAALSLVLLSTALPIDAADMDDHIFCVAREIGLTDSDTRRSFYTAVFSGDYSKALLYEGAFSDFLEEEYDEVLTNSYCFFENTPRAATRALGRKSDHDRSDFLWGEGVIMTGWAPNDFANQDIQDFSMQISDDVADLEICVRDHECEDGDRITVAVEDRRVFSGEIDNDWVCKTMEVVGGRRYEVELLAINGTGHKGYCSFADVNTGEIRVSADNTVTQSWRHRGGAGSRAQIIVEPR